MCTYAHNNSSSKVGDVTANNLNKSLKACGLQVTLHATYSCTCVSVYVHVYVDRTFVPSLCVSMCIYVIKRNSICVGLFCKRDLTIRESTHRCHPIWGGSYDASFLADARTLCRFLSLYSGSAALDLRHLLSVHHRNLAKKGK